MNEASQQKTVELTATLQEVVRLKDEHLALAQRSEDIERSLRKLLGIAAP